MITQALLYDRIGHQSSVIIDELWGPVAQPWMSLILNAQNRLLREKINDAPNCMFISETQ